jgi:hypothetical protein
MRVQHQFARIANERNDGGTTYGSNCLGRSVGVGRAQALQDNPYLYSPEPRSTQQFEPSPHPLLDIVAEVPRGLWRISSAAYVFVMNEELGGIRAFVDAGYREDRESRRPSADSID